MSLYMVFMQYECESYGGMGDFICLAKSLDEVKSVMLHQDHNQKDFGYAYDYETLHLVLSFERLFDLSVEFKEHKTVFPNGSRDDALLEAYHLDNSLSNSNEINLKKGKRL